ncbi:MAG: asparagine synthase (glutamine-hydrolyzing) [Lachnospiraceae bacterium]|nr:asparagine synthase (glutamine-hydrolyzing) [Lachnospiraceae bacterium]
MCGIAGFFNANQSLSEQKSHWENVLANMHRCLAHRGSDGAGIYLREHVGLSHARLAIRDIEKGTQPMVRRHPRGEYAIVYNGEIYNTAELIPRLRSAGYRFQTTSDTEVILYAYIHYGKNFVSLLNGIFSFAIWDGARNELLLYRDRVGVKPLFYTVFEDTLVFGSEPKAVFTYPGLTPSINENSLQELLAIGPARTSGNGVFANLHEVMPGHFLCYSGNGLTDTMYWDIPCREHRETYEETVLHTGALVRNAITRQMVSDVPVCTFLSGGIDSSIVTSVAARHMREHGETLNTFSFDFTGNDVYFKSNAFQPERDLPYVNQMLAFCPTNHTYLECDQQTLFDKLFEAVDAKDLPGMTDVDASLLYFCSLVAEHNKVALTGECADEIFGGYPWFYRPELMNRNGFPWSDDISARTLFLSEDFYLPLHLQEYSYDRYRDSLNRAPALESDTPEEARRRRITYLNIKWFMQTLLDRMDRASMYSGLEARVPFADHHIIEYVCNVPWEMKYQNGVEKALLRDACADLLPESLLHRKKSPYPKTYHPGYEQLLIQKMQNILADTNAPIQPMLDKQKLSQFLNAPKEYGKPWFGQLMAGPQLLAYFIQINDWMEKYHLSL